VILIGAQKTKMLYRKKKSKACDLEVSDRSKDCTGN
jgi:hypothetical protein